MAGGVRSGAAQPRAQDRSGLKATSGAPRDRGPRSNLSWLHHANVDRLWVKWTDSVARPHIADRRRRLDENLGSPSSTRTGQDRRPSPARRCSIPSSSSATATTTIRSDRSGWTWNVLVAKAPGGRRRDAQGATRVAPTRRADRAGARQRYDAGRRAKARSHWLRSSTAADPPAEAAGPPVDPPRARASFSGT